MRKLSLVFILMGLVAFSFAQSASNGCISGNCDDGYGVYIWKDSGSKYAGYWKNGMKHGRGTLTWGQNTKWAGDKYIGDFYENERHGQGKYIYASGTVYEGDMVHDKFEGKGKFTWTSGAHYEGEVLDDYRHGQGVYTWASGTSFTGWSKRGIFEGWGKFTYGSGDYYVGEVSKDLREGFGIYYYKSGKKYIGQLVKGDFTGWGVMFETDGSTKVGQWKNDVYQGASTNKVGCLSGNCKNGYGVNVWKEGDYYAGYWKNGKINGEGFYFFPTGNAYRGEWLNSKRNGWGTAYYKDGTQKSGYWLNDEFQGKKKKEQQQTGCTSGNCTDGYGVYVFASGSVYKGYWKNDKYNGQGNYTDKTGFVYVGEFKDDKYHGKGVFTATDGTVRDGYWKEGEFQGAATAQYGCVSGDCVSGYGTYIWNSSTDWEGTKYVGYWKNDKFNGQGSFTYGSRTKWAGDNYTGTYVNGTKQGFGTYTWSSGNKYVGEWVNNTMEGQGTFSYKSGKRYVGTMVGNDFHGYGTMYYTDGSKEVGMWEHDVFKGQKNNSIPPPKVSWLEPVSLTTTSSSPQANIKICIKSKSQLKNVQIFVNGELQVNNADRGYTVVSSGCDYTIERSVELRRGSNKIEITVQNGGGSASSDIRYIKYEKQEQLENRYALVIGNSNYTNAPLRNPVNDARAMAAELRKLGFDVTMITDGTNASMIRKIREFGNKLSENRGVGLFYYAGHGMQVNGQNYLIPVNAQIEKEQDVELETVDLRRVLGEMDAAHNRLNIVILDACRNNPFARSFSRSVSRGLATPVAPQGTFIAYATSPGSVAADGSGKNGLYTQELLKALRVPGLKIEDVFKKVRVNVYSGSAKKQVPWENSSIFGDFYFKK